MHKIKLRTKIEVGFVGLLLLLTMVVSVASVTRTISDTRDNIETFIRNSNGKYWDATFANIQVAIDDIGDLDIRDKGTVWLAGNTIYAGNGNIQLRDGVTLEGNGARIVNWQDVNVIEMARSSTVRDLCIDLRYCGSTFTKAAIYVDGAEKIYYETPVLVEDIKIYGENQEGAALRIECDNYNEYCNFGHFKNIRSWNTGYTIHINVPTGASPPNQCYVNSNLFYNIIGMNDQYFIYLDRNMDIANKNDCSIDTNGFINCHYQTGVDTDGGIYVTGRGNYFQGIMIWDWSLAPASTWFYDVTSDAEDTLIEARGGNLGNPTDYIDNGEDTILIDFQRSMINTDYLDIDTNIETPRLNQDGTNLHVFQYTTSNPFFWIHGYNGNSVRPSLKIRVDSSGNAELLTTTGDIEFLPEGYVDMSTKEVKVKIYSQATAPDIADDSVAYWYNTASGYAYTILDIGGTQYYTNMTTTYQ